jgi:penicillin-insensitive murein endopeptidase
MRALFLILKASFAVGLLLSVVAFLGGLEQPARHETVVRVKPKPALQNGDAAVSATAKPAVVYKPAGAPASGEMSLSQSTAAPEPKIEDSLSQRAPEFEAAAAPPQPQPDMVRVAAAPAQTPVPNAGPIPAIPQKQPPAPARELFGAAKEPANMATRSIGFYSMGCLAGAKPLPVDGPAWQAMRLSRNRVWGHPSLIKYIERFAADAKAKDGWPGLLVGDLSMPRGGPMPFGHASHQVGLDVDIWYRPMPDRKLTKDEREQLPMESFLTDPGHVNAEKWTPDFVKLLRRSVSYPEVARVFVNPAIKKWLCDNVQEDRGFLHKISAIMGHDEHFHVRLSCPAGDEGCRNQPPLPPDEGCGKGLDTWIAALSKPKTPVAVPVAPPPAPLLPKPASATAATPKPNGRTPITMAQLPPECDAVLKAPPPAAITAK